MVTAPEKEKKPQGKGQKAAIGDELVEESVPTYGRPPAKRNAPINLNASDQQLERAYFNTIRNLQFQIKDHPQYSEQCQRPELNKNHPHLCEEEVNIPVPYAMEKRNAAATGDHISCRFIREFQAGVSQGDT